MWIRERLEWETLVRRSIGNSFTLSHISCASSAQVRDWEWWEDEKRRGRSRSFLFYSDTIDGPSYVYSYSDVSLLYVVGITNSFKCWLSYNLSLYNHSSLVFHSLFVYMYIYIYNILLTSIDIFNVMPYLFRLIYPMTSDAANNFDIFKLFNFLLIKKKKKILETELIEEFI